MPLRVLFSQLIAAVVLFSSGRGHAQEASKSFHVQAEIGTNAPLDLHAGVLVELPYRIRLSTELGYFPGFYSNTINDLLVSFGAYSRQVGDFINSSIKSSLVWRTHIGWRPFPKEGFYFSVGYGLIGLGGNATGRDVIEQVTGRPFPSSEAADARLFDASTVAHMFDVEVGWEFLAWERLVIRPAIGGAFTLAASSKLEPMFTPRNVHNVNEYVSYAENYLNDIMTTYVQIPVISLSVGYRFF